MKDLYSSTFRHLHQRDLYLMSKVLKANAVLIEPWDPAEKHDDFMELCRPCINRLFRSLLERSYGLFVILTFDLKYFFQELAFEAKAICKVLCHDV